MKKIISLCLLLAVETILAQTFEGSINWSIKTEVTDPQLKAKMAEGQAKMNDPATQAKMKEMQEMMSNPQMKAMMEMNPQMKAQMESMMKVTQTGDISSMLPSGMKLKIKGANTLTIMEGGMAMEILYLKDKDKSYKLDRQGKTYSVLQTGAGKNAGATTQPKITKTSETAKILNYTCTKYTVEVVEQGKTVTHTFWTTTEIKDIDMKSLAKQGMSRGNQSMFYEGIDGVPLKIEMSMAEMKMEMEVTEIKKETLSPSSFSIDGFTEVKSPY